MSLTPGYGETQVPDDELDDLLPAIRELLGEPVTEAAVYDLEQAVQAETAEELLTPVLSGSLTVTPAHLESYDWQLDKRRYIELLREYDEHRDPGGFIGTQLIGP